MRTFVLDTSVTLAWYLLEEFSPAARSWLDQLLEGKVNLLVPSLHYWEFANALRSLVMRAEITEAAAVEILDLHLDARLSVAEPERRDVLKTALEYGATAYDAVFITLALSRDLPLITAERTTSRWVTKLGKRVVSVS
jgi:predicted nucleic acid-binding protein